MLIKILEHRIYKTEPAILIDNDILINSPRFSKKVSANNLLLTHSHKENLLGLSNIKYDKKLIDIFVAKEHERFFKYHKRENFLDFRLNHIVSKKSFKINDLEITPIAVQHEIQKTYGKLCMAFLINKRVMICTPCNKISKNALQFFKNLDVLIIDGGYKNKQLNNDHNSISETLNTFKDSNIKRIYFLGTYQDYQIKGKLKDSETTVDTLFSGDIIRVK